MWRFAWPWLMCRCLLGTYCNAGQWSPPHSIMLQRLFSMPNAGGSFKAVVSGLGHCVVGITLPSGILMSNLCCQTASSTFPPHIFFSTSASFAAFVTQNQFRPFLLGFLAPSTAVHLNTHHRMLPPPHTHANSLSLSLLSQGKLVPHSLGCIFSIVSFVSFPGNKGFLCKRGTETGGDGGQRKT